MARTTVFVVVEGQTENAFLTRFLGAHLGTIGIDLHCPIVKLGAGRGGTLTLRCEDLCDQIRRHLKDRRRPFVSTFFDYYALPCGAGRGWDFVHQAKSEAGFRGLDSTVESIERELHRQAIEGLELPNIADRFIPYIQLHELEALFFSEPETMASAFDNPALALTFARAAADCGGCERINDRPQTAPSKRIQAAFPGYMKGRSDFAHGPRLAEKLSIPVVRQACPRFAAWLTGMEALREIK